MATRSDRTTGEYRDPRHGRGFGPAGSRPQTRVERREWLIENRKKPAHGRYAGTPYLQQGYVKRALVRAARLLDAGRPSGPRPHPTKRGPGRV